MTPCTSTVRGLLSAQRQPDPSGATRVAVKYLPPTPLPSGPIGCILAPLINLPGGSCGHLADPPHGDNHDISDTPPPLTLLATALVALVLALPGGADANPANGMIDGNYAAQMLPAYYLHKHLRAGVRRVCIQISTPRTTEITGTVKTQAPDGNWTVRHQATLVPARGAAGTTALSRQQMADLLGIDVDDLHIPRGTIIPSVRDPGQEGCRHYDGLNDARDKQALEGHAQSLVDAGVAKNLDEARTLLGVSFERAPKPMNWCGERRTITPAHGWSGKLRSDNTTIHVQVRNHYMNMPGRVLLTHGRACP